MPTEVETDSRLLPFRVDRTWTVFLDRDGVLNRRVEGDYVRSADQFELLPGVPEAVAALSGVAGRVVVVTNQRVIGLGLMTATDVAVVHDELRRQVTAAGGRIDAVVVCPHTLEDGCRCRKPGPGLVEQAAATDPGIDLRRAVVVGDSVSDMGLAAGLGLPGVWIGGSPPADATGAVAGFDDLASFATAVLAASLPATALPATALPATAAHPEEGLP